MLYGSLMHLSVVRIFGRIRLAGGRRGILTALIVLLCGGVTIGIIRMRCLGFIFAVGNGDDRCR